MSLLWQRWRQKDNNSWNTILCTGFMPFGWEKNDVYKIETMHKQYHVQTTTWYMNIVLIQTTWFIWKYYGITILVQCICKGSLLKTLSAGLFTSIHIPRSNLDFTFPCFWTCTQACWSEFNLLNKLSVLLRFTRMNENYHITPNK